MLINAKRRAPEYLEIHDFNSEGYFDLVRAAASLPFVGHGEMILHGIPYHDILHNSNLPEIMRHVLATDATDILVLYNYPWQKKFVDRKVNITKEGTRVMEICLEREPMSRFETRSGKLRRAGVDAEKIMNRLLEV
jgi:hypothetical protein